MKIKTAGLFTTRPSRYLGVFKTMNKFVVNLSDAEAADALRFGPKTANQAILAHGGLPTPGGFCLGADAYCHQLETLGLTEVAEKAMSLPFMESRAHVADVRIGLFSEPIQSEIKKELVTAYRALVDKYGGRIAVRSSSLMEDTEGSSFAGQFQTFLGIESEEDFLTALRACWGALWSPRAMRYMDDKNIKATDTAMAVLVQPLVEAEVSGGGLSDLTRKYTTVDGVGNTKFYHLENYQGRMQGPYYENQQAYMDNSPIWNVDRVNTPLLLYAGKEDYHVNRNQSIAFYLGLKRAGKESSLLLYPDQGHAFSNLKAIQDLNDRILEWFEHYLKGGPKSLWMKANAY